MRQLIEKLRSEIVILSANPNFIHHEWFITHHLEIVEKISLELYERYPEANQNLVLVLVWMHDYGKLIDFENQKDATVQHGPAFLEKIGFEKEFATQVISYIEILDKKKNLMEAPIEVQIVSSADGASHFVGAFHKVYWQEKSEYSYDQLCESNSKKAEIDWNQKMVLPEIKEAFKDQYEYSKTLNKTLPNKYLL